MCRVNVPNIRKWREMDSPAFSRNWKSPNRPNNRTRCYVWPHNTSSLHTANGTLFNSSLRIFHNKCIKALNARHLSVENAAEII